MNDMLQWKHYSCQKLKAFIVKYYDICKMFSVQFYMYSVQFNCSIQFNLSYK